MYSPVRPSIQGEAIITTTPLASVHSCKISLHCTYLAPPLSGPQGPPGAISVGSGVLDAGGEREGEGVPPSVVTGCLEEELEAVEPPPQLP